MTSLGHTSTRYQLAPPLPLLIPSLQPPSFFKGRPAPSGKWRKNGPEREAKLSVRKFYHRVVGHGGTARRD